VKNQNATEPELSAADNKDSYYYGSLYVPFDTRLSSTIDGAFTLVNDATANKGQVTMQSLSQLNGMGNPQYVPAEWPVIVRTNHPATITMMNQPATTYATRHYVNMYLPYDAPQATTLTDERKSIVLMGEYLERELDDTYMKTKTSKGDYTLTGKQVMVFGLPFKDHAATHDDATHHEYDEYKQVGWYTNDNWARETYSGYKDGDVYTAYKAHEAQYPTAPNTAFTGGSTVATDDQRSKLYVYHNRVYYPSPIADPAGSRHIVALFEPTSIDDDQPIADDATGSNAPWPCDVYDLQGRRVAENETPATLRRNHPRLRPGVYIFAGRRVIVR